MYSLSVRWLETFIYQPYSELCTFESFHYSVSEKDLCYAEIDIGVKCTQLLKKETKVLMCLYVVI